MRVLRLGAVLAACGGLLGAGGCSSCDSASTEPLDASPDAPIADSVDAADSADAAQADVFDGGGPLCPTPRRGTSALHGRVFGATALGLPTVPVYEATDLDGGTVGAPFAMVPSDGFFGPMVLTIDGKFYVATTAQKGSIWEISAGGDFSAKTPVASGVFSSGPNGGSVEGMALDADGTFYLSYSDIGLTRIAEVTPNGGTISLLPTPFDNPTGLVVCNGVLFVAEAGQGRVVRRNLASGTERIWATGFIGGQDHVSAMMVVDQRGHLLVNWRTAGDGGNVPAIFDITDGGDFSTATPLVLSTFNKDVNEIAVNEANDIFATGASSGELYVARAMGSTWSPFVVFARGLSDTESIGVGP